MPNPFVGEVRVWAGSYAPTGWAFCNGQILPISQNTALFMLLGNRYGGNGISTFALPNLQCRIPIHPGQGPGLTNRALAESAGAETHLLATSQIPAHGHTIGASSANGTSDQPAGHVMARNPSAIPEYSATADIDLAAGAIGSSGGGQAHNNMAPYLGLTFIIALQGAFPPHP
jgi:microcystin-dependent protein